MRVCWVPHKGLREVWIGKEERVLQGKTAEEDNARDIEVSTDELQEEKQPEEYIQ